MDRAQRTVFLVRHGESASNAGGVTQAHASIPLTALGREQSRNLVGRLPGEPTRVLASPFVRAMETARPYAAHANKTIELEPLLQEFDMIDLRLIVGMNQSQRRPVAESYWQEADPYTRLGDEAETFQEFAERVATFLRETLCDLPDGAVCFGHGIWIGMAAWQLLGFPTGTSSAMRQFRRFQTGLPLPNAVIYRLVEHRPGVWSFMADEQRHFSTVTVT